MSYIYVPASGVDDTFLFQTAINKIRVSNGGKISLENKQYVLTNKMDCTALSGLEIEGCPNTRIHPIFQSSQPVFDFTDSSNWAIKNMEIFCSGPHTFFPTYAVYAQNQDKIVIDRVRTPGKWTASAVGIIGSHSVTLRDCQLSNFDEVAPALLISSLPGRNTSDVFSANCEYHCAIDNPYTIKLNNCDNLQFFGGICDNSKNAHVLSQGVVSHVSFETVKFYSELGRPSGAVVLSNSPDSLTHLRICNPTRDGIPLITAGAGVDPSTLRVETP